MKNIFFFIVCSLLGSAAFCQPARCSPGFQDSTCRGVLLNAAQAAPTCSTAAGWVTTSSAVWQGSAWSSPGCSFTPAPVCPVSYTLTAAPTWNGTAWSGLQCSPPATPASCAAKGQSYNSSSNACQALYDCPSTILPWAGTGPVTPLKDATPTVLTPDGHAWCYYYGRGGNDGGAPWAAAFDRVVGKPVTYYPLYQEVYLGESRYSYNVGAGDAAVVVAYTLYSWGFANNSSSYIGLIALYGGPANMPANTSYGGSKCAPGHSTGSTGYYNAWYPSDCQGNGISSLTMSRGFPSGGWCAYDTASGSPARSRGVTRAQLGGTLTVGNGSYSTNDGGSLDSENGLGCAPNMSSGTVSKGDDMNY